MNTPVWIYSNLLPLLYCIIYDNNDDDNDKISNDDNDTLDA